MSDRMQRRDALYRDELVERIASIARAIELLREQFDQPLSMDGVARQVGMSPSSFHQHFKGITDMTPLQFQKRVRLQGRLL